MKRAVTIALIVSGGLYATIVLGSLLSGEETASESLGSPTASPSPSTASTFTLAEVAEHAARDDCWLVIRGKVYNVTSFLGRHPGGASAIAPYCGGEATEAFETQGNPGGGGSHSSVADQTLQNYLIGELE